MEQFRTVFHSLEVCRQIIKIIKLSPFVYNYNVYSSCSSPQTVLASGNFELQILEISNSKNLLLSGTCCGLPYQLRETVTTGKFIEDQL